MSPQYLYVYIDQTDFFTPLQNDRKPENKEKFVHLKRVPFPSGVCGLEAGLFNTVCSMSLPDIFNALRSEVIGSLLVLLKKSEALKRVMN